MIDKTQDFIFKKKTFKPFIDYSLASDQKMMKKFQSNRDFLTNWESFGEKHFILAFIIKWSIYKQNKLWANDNKNV